MNVKCMQTDSGGHGLSGFGDFAPSSYAFKMAKIPFLAINYSPWGSKNIISSKNSFEQRLQICHANFPFWAMDYSLWNIL